MEPESRKATSVVGAAKPTRRAAAWAAAAVVVFLVATNIAEHLVRNLSLWVGVPGAVALILFGFAVGLSWDDLGLGRAHLRTGVLVGAATIAVVAAVYLAGVLIPATRSAFLDKRYDVGVLKAFGIALVKIPLGTIVFEEVAFRGVLWALLARNMAPRYVLLVTSVLFGFWHVLPSLHLAASNSAVGDAVGGSSGSATTLAVAGTVAFTAVGGAVFGVLRWRSRSLIPSMCAHWATNGLGVLFGLLARSLG